MPTKGRSTVAFDEIVARLVPDPASPRHMRCLFGYVGPAAREKHVRVYQNPSMTDFVDVPEDAVIHAVQVSPSQSPLGGSYLWVRGDAELPGRFPGGGYPPFTEPYCPPATVDCPIPSENLPCPPTPYPQGCGQPQLPGGPGLPRTPVVFCPPPPTPIFGCPPPTLPWQCPPPTLPWHGCPPPTVPWQVCPPPPTLSPLCPTRATCPPPTAQIWCAIRTRPIICGPQTPFCPTPQTMACPTPRTPACGGFAWGGGDPAWATPAGAGYGFDPYATGPMGGGW